MSERTLIIYDGELRATFETASGHTATVQLTRQAGGTLGLAVASQGFESGHYFTPGDMLAAGECIKSLARCAKEEVGR